MTDFCDRLKKAMELKGISQAELCKLTEIPKSAMSQYLSGSFKPKQKRTYLLAKALDVNEAWLMGFDDASIERDPIPSVSTVTRNAEQSNAAILPDSSVYMIPVFEKVSAGFGAYACSDVVDYIPLFVNNKADVADTLCIKVQGNSMYPKIEDGDLVVVRKQTSVDSGSIAVVLIDGEEGFVKKIVYGDNFIELQSINPEYQTKLFKGRDVLRVSVVGIVKQIIKEV